MNRSKDVAALVADIVIRWVRSQVRHGMPPRLNMRLVFGDEVLVNAVQAGLESENERASSGPYFVVRGSSHEQAVLFRNGRPAGVSPGRPIVYGMFWQPGTDFTFVVKCGFPFLRTQHVEQVSERLEVTYFFKPSCEFHDLHN